MQNRTSCSSFSTRIILLSEAADEHRKDEFMFIWYYHEQVAHAGVARARPPHCDNTKVRAFLALLCASQLCSADLQLEQTALTWLHISNAAAYCSIGSPSSPNYCARSYCMSLYPNQKHHHPSSIGQTPLFTKYSMQCVLVLFSLSKERRTMK